MTLGLFLNVGIQCCLLAINANEELNKTDEIISNLLKFIVILILKPQLQLRSLDYTCRYPVCEKCNIVEGLNNQHLVYQAFGLTIFCVLSQELNRLKNA